MIFDVYFHLAEPMVVAVEADSEEEAIELVESGEIDLDKFDLLNRFKAVLDYDDSVEVVYVEEVE